MEDAILLLGGQKPVEDVTVAELSTTASVHRTSFYSHASSPADLLVSALVGELEPEVRELQKELDRADAEFSRYWERFYRLILTHVSERKDVYKQAVAANSVLLTGLSEHFLEWVEESIEKMSPYWEDPEPSSLWVDMARQQQAHSLVAVITAWVSGGFTESIDGVLEEYWTLAPPWQLAKKDSSGFVRMQRRSRTGRDSSQPLVERL